MDSARALALARMGIDRYVLRERPDADAGVPAPLARAPGPSPAALQGTGQDSGRPPTPPTPGGAQPGPAPMSAPGPARPAGGAMPAGPVYGPAAPAGPDPHLTLAGPPTAPGAWDTLTADIAACRACGLCETRTRTVPGVGLRQARWLVVGEAPGQEEDERGEPFVGRAGKLLDSMLYAVGLDRSNCYIANVLKCRPPGNRNPTPDEAAACRPFLDRQIALIAPRLILAVGAVPARYLLQTELAVGKLRGQVHRLPGTDLPLVVTYHPAYLLRSPLEKRKVWDDLCLARDAVAPV